jgi:hypothetical protein
MLPRIIGTMWVKLYPESITKTHSGADPSDIIDELNGTKEGPEYKRIISGLLIRRIARAELTRATED